MLKPLFSLYAKKTSYRSHLVVLRSTTSRQPFFCLKFNSDLDRYQDDDYMEMAVKWRYAMVKKKK